MPFSLSCGDVMPGCAVRFQADSQEQLFTDVARHASADHAITDITPEILEQVTIAVRFTPV